MESTARGIPEAEPRTEVNFVGFIPRLIAYIIDSIFITLVGLIVAMTAGIFAELANLMILNVASIAVSLFSPVYLVAFWAMMGATPGKVLLGMRIVTDDGRANGIGWMRALLRLVGYFASSFLCYLGFLWIAFDKDSQGWHDKIARTYVVNV